MARTALSVQEISHKDASAASYTAAPGSGSGNGFEIASDPSHRTLIDVDASSNTVVVTITTPNMVDDFSIAERTVSVTNGTHKFIPLRRVNKEASNLTAGTSVYFVDFDLTTNVTVAALKVTAE